MMARGSLTQVRRGRRVVNALTTRIVQLGGAGVIAAITLIFLYLLWVVAPIFQSATIETGQHYTLPAAQALLIETNESDDVGLRIAADGSTVFFDLSSGAIISERSIGRSLKTVHALTGQTGVYAVIDTAGNISFLQALYPISFVDDRRVVTPRLEFLFDDDWIALGGGADIDAFDAHYSGQQVLIATLSGTSLNIALFREVESGYPLELPRETRMTVSRDYQTLMFGPRAQWLYLVDDGGAVELLDLARPMAPQIQFAGRLTTAGARINAIAPLLGRYSLMVADDRNLVTQWFLVRGERGYGLTPIRSFKLSAPARQIIPEPRRKGFAVIDHDNALTLFHATANRRLASHPLQAGEVGAASIAPRAGRLLTAGPDGSVQGYRLDNEHPEISWSSLWSKVWYEGYPEPVYSWQSSSADNDFEPKFSLTPLLFGTLKGAFYALLFAVPVAIMGALYTAFFMAPAMRRIVKPGIEMMAALPTVILGFLAGLWLAPLIEANLAAVLAIMLVMPAGIMTMAWVWSRIPDQLSARFAGWQGLIALPVIVGTVWLAFALGPWIEILVFGGSTQGWILENLGLPYDQRNALVVGMAMGLAVIPTIFSIAEDAIYGVPTHLINGSLALGATPWQTLTRVVLLTASPGIFSAVMIGLGRAVGETMIVLMATGNTPIMDMNIFEGMRTFAANIAVELPEAAVDSSHYRILFLAAMVLFLITFLFNTVAEVVRQRLRTRYGNL